MPFLRTNKPSIINSRKNILIIVNSNNFLLKKMINKNRDQKIYLATYDIELIEKYKKNILVEEVLFLENMETLFSVSERLNRVVKIVNDYFLDEFKEKLLFFSKHAEGGELTQKIQDVILFSNSFNKIIDTYNIDLVIDILDANFIIEKKYIKEIILERNIKYNRLNKKSIKEYGFVIWKAMKIYLNDVYSFFVYCYILLLNAPSNICTNNNTLILSLHSKAHKFYDRFMPFIKLVEENTEYKCLALTYGISITPQMRESYSDRIMYLEKHQRGFDYIKSFVFRLRLMFIFYRTKKKLINELDAYSMVLTKQIIQSIKFLIHKEFGNRYRYEKALFRFLSYNKISGLKLWGNVAVAEGIIANNLIKIHFPKVKTFHFDLGIGLKDLLNFSDSINDLDFMIFSNDLERKVYISNGLRQDKAIILNIGNLSESFSQKKIITKIDSLNKLGIDNKYKKYILVDIHHFMRGCIHLQEILLLLNYIKKLGVIFYEYCFIIKPHPNFTNYGYLSKYFSTYSNIQVFNSALPIFHFINICDVLLTKYSLIGFDAIIHNKLVISILLDREKKWKMYGKASVYVYELSDIEKYLREIELLKESKKEYIKALSHQLLPSFNERNLEFLHEKLRV